MNQPLILIIDDETAILKTLKDALEDENFCVETLDDGSKVLETIGKLVPELVFLDIFLPNYNGIELLSRIKKEYPTQNVIMISGFGTISLALDAIKKGALDFIEKPLNLDEILNKIAFLKNQHSPEFPHDEATTTHGSNFIGASALFCELMHHTTLIAPLDLPTVIYGPTGSGRSLLAKTIHAKSKHANGSFIEINCETMPDLSSDLDQKTGTIFLKNIHELSTTGQKKVLSILDNKRVRIVASSLPHLFTLAQTGKFNKSLFCKLSVTPLEIPSINKRRYDIPLLVDHFVNQANEQYKKNIALTPAAIRLLRNYTWTGDVAQIKTIINTIAQITIDQTIIDAATLCMLLPENTSSFIGEQLFSRFNSLQQATDAFEQRYLLHLLKKYRYNTNQLAEFLQIPVSQLHDKMIKLQIDQR
jgi:DNA-binding NtrC family response regulator